MFNIFLVCLPEGSPKMSTKLRAICCRPWIKLMWRPKKDPWRAWCVSVPRGSHVGSHEGRLGIDTRYKLSNLCMFRAYYVFFSLRIVYVYRYGKHIYICVYIYILIITVCVCVRMPVRPISGASLIFEQAVSKDGMSASGRWTVLCFTDEVLSCSTC